MIQDLYRNAEAALLKVMRHQSYRFKGRGVEPGKGSCRIIECASGTVMAITFACHGVEFIQGYCRRAIIDRWGLYCDRPFRRASDAALTRSWAEPCKKGLLLFRPTRLEIVREEEWMTQRR